MSIAIASTHSSAKAADETSQRRVALVVGNAHYTGLPELSNSLNDSGDLCAALRELHFEVLCFQDIKTRREFKRHIQEFKSRLGPGTAGLFYFAGHGMQIDGENYLLPTDAQIRNREDVEDETLSVRFLMGTLTDARNDFNLVILDACRDSPFTRGFSRGIWRGLAPVTETPSGSLVLYATAANEQASDGATGDRNSPFAKHFLANIHQPGLTVEGLIKRVSAAVQEETFKTTHRRQTPFSYGAFTGEFCFAGCTVQPDIKGAPTRIDTAASTHGTGPGNTGEIDRGAESVKPEPAGAFPNGARAGKAVTDSSRKVVIPPTF